MKVLRLLTGLGLFVSCGPASVAGSREPLRLQESASCGLEVSASLRELCGRVNRERMERSLPPLQLDARLVEAAQVHAEDMARRNYFDHTSPEGESFVERFRRAGVSFRNGAENIAWGQRSAGEVHAAWMDSEGHRENLLNPRLGRLGLGFAEGRWVQTFVD